MNQSHRPFVPLIFATLDLWFASFPDMKLILHPHPKKPHAFPCVNCLSVLPTPEIGIVCANWVRFVVSDNIFQSFLIFLAKSTLPPPLPLCLLPARGSPTSTIHTQALSMLRIYT